MLHVQNVVVIILMTLVHYNKFKSLEILKNGTFMYNKFNIKNFLSTYERWGFGCEESRVWLIYLNEITNVLNHTIS